MNLKNKKFWLVVAFMCLSFALAVYAISQNADLLGVTAILNAISGSIMLI